MKYIYNIGILIILLAGLCSPVRGVEMNDEQLFRPFDQSSRPVATLPAAPASSAVPLAGDGFYSRQLLLDDNSDNPAGSALGDFAPAGEMPWWQMLIGAAAMGMGVRWRRKTKN
jgi:hypothetical protein